MAAKILGQTAPAATTYTTALYFVPSGKETVTSTLSVANRAATADTFRIRIAQANAAADNKQYVAYDVAIAANSVITFTLGMTLAAGDYVYAGSNAGNCSFNLFGDER